MITTTNETGYYKFTNVEVEEYYLNFTKLRYEDYSTELTVQSGKTKEGISISKQYSRSSILCERCPTHFM